MNRPAPALVGTGNVRRPAPHFWRWPDTGAIEARTAALLDLPPQQPSIEATAAVHAWFESNCRASKRVAAEMTEFVPGGSQHTLAFDHPFPLSIASGQGPHVTDIDGNRYIDLVAVGGPLLLGHRCEPVAQRMAEVLANVGPATGMLHDYELRLARLVHDFMPGVERLRMLASGTEAVMAALRIARAFTGNRYVVKMGGAYHGWSDQMMFGLRVPGSGAFEAAGIPPESYALTQEARPNDLDELRHRLKANEADGGTAAVIVEPLGPESGVLPAHRDFNAEVRELCDRAGALLIFDEVVTGFRMGMGGVQEFLQVRPDLTVLGKCLTGGYLAAGAVGGRQDVMDICAGGVGVSDRQARLGGTLSANPLSCAGGYYSLLEMDRSDAPALAGAAGDRLTEGLRRAIDSLGAPFVVYNFASIVHLHTSGVLHIDLRRPGWFDEVGPRLGMLREVSAALAAAGVLTVGGSRFFVSSAHTPEVIDDTVARISRVLATTTTP